jgi:hypothetical protein
VESIGRVTQVNPKALNAFSIWSEGKDSPILDYPAEYGVLKGHVAPDGVFYLPKEWFSKDDHCVFSATPGATVKGDVLTYLVKDGRGLALKFSPMAKDQFDHAGAVQYCKNLGLRLPQMQELLDFCAAGTRKDYRGIYEKNRCPPKSAIWSASVSSGHRGYALLFNSTLGLIAESNRTWGADVLCVGGL